MYYYDDIGFNESWDLGLAFELWPCIEMFYPAMKGNEGIRWRQVT